MHHGNHNPQSSIKRAVNRSLGPGTRMVTPGPYAVSKRPERRWGAPKRRSPRMDRDNDGRPRVAVDDLGGNYDLKIPFIPSLGSALVEKRQVLRLGRELPRGYRSLFPESGQYDHRVFSEPVHKAGDDGIRQCVADGWGGG